MGHGQVPVGVQVNSDDTEMLEAAAAFLKAWEALHLKPYGLRLSVIEGDDLVIMNLETGNYAMVH